MKLLVGGEEYPFDVNSFTNEEGMAIEAKTLLSFGQWLRSIGDMNMKSLTTLVWLVQRRKDPTKKWEDTIFRITDVKFVAEEGDDEDIKKTVGAQEIVPGELNADLGDFPNADASGTPEAPSTTDETST